MKDQAIAEAQERFSRGELRTGEKFGDNSYSERFYEVRHVAPNFAWAAETDGRTDFAVLKFHRPESTA